MKGDSIKVFCYIQLLKNTKYAQILLNHFWYSINPFAFAFAFCIKINFAELQLLPMMVFYFNTLPR